MKILTEAGRVLSKQNEDAIRAALAALKVVLDKLGGADATEAATSIAAVGAALDESDRFYAESEAPAEDGVSEAAISEPSEFIEVAS